MWSCRVALILGSILTTTGLLLSGFVRDINYVIFLIGIVSGFGACLSIHASEIVIGYNFVRYRNLACGIAVSGTGIGTLLFTPLMQMAKDYYGYTGLCLMCSALSLHLSIFAALCRPSFIEIKSKKEGKGHVRKAVSDFLRSFRLLRHGHFAFLCSSMTTSAFGIFLMNVHFTSLVLEQGSSKTSAANFLSISGACNACARFLVGMASNSDNINELLLYSGCFSILGISALAIPTYIEYYGGQIAFAMFLGTYSGCCYTLLNTINVKLLGIENLSMAYGIELLAGGIGATSGPVVSGKSAYRDRHHKKTWLYFFSQTNVTVIPYLQDS
ncbi:hypothetical protein FSP39_020681 [Pinctada imbricata]|uniref:Uncharacterized protein n=1 Tax=Pinctada imbricata TaxID=66713 RepID=A0AA88YHZ5_PINIB|nr:hypothetical protein FSP39_020681 [Pinctada imbricata]